MKTKKIRGIRNNINSTFCIYDHFGLDKPDIEKMYVNLADLEYGMYYNIMITLMVHSFRSSR